MSGPAVATGKHLSIVEHLRELRIRIITSLIAGVVGAAAAFVLYEPIIELLYLPFQAMGPDEPETLLYINTITEGFLVKIKVSVLTGIILSLPVHLFNGVRFVFPGLTRRERSIVGASLIASFLLAGFSVYYGYFQIVPVSIRFLTTGGFIPERIGMLLGFSRNIFYILRFLLVTLLVFQLPIVLEVLLAMGVLRRKALLKASRYVIVGIFLLAAVLTPPDFISQVSLALPMIVLYFLTILVAWVFRLGSD